jgi:hypothetical protein
MKEDLYGLKTNPFLSQSLIREKDFDERIFVETKIQQQLISYFVFGYKPEKPIWLVIHGERGIGKTTSLLWVKRDIERNGKGDEEVTYINSLPHLKAQDYDSLKSTDAPHFLLYDFPDKWTKEQLDFSMLTLNRLLQLDQVSLFLAMNTSTYGKSFHFSDVLGKFAVLKMPEFSLEETKEMMMLRLAVSRKDDFKALWDFYPFQENAIPLIFRKAKGIPRRIITICSQLLNYGIKEQIESIDGEFVKQELRVSDWADDILNEKVADPSKRKLLNLLLQAIDERFDGFVRQQQLLTKYMNEKYGWSHIKTKKLLDQLAQKGLRIIEERSNPEDGWSKQYIL